MLPPPTVILEAHQIVKSWCWMKNSINRRPSVKGGRFIFDRKVWQTSSSITGPLTSAGDAPGFLATLYLAGQFGDHSIVTRLINNNPLDDLVSYLPHVDSDIKVVINSKRRFRNHLSEHLAFWVYLATMTKSGIHWRIARSMPNFQPEDKGPDGVSVTLSSETDSGVVEVHSVKNSINNPRNLISTGSMRNKGKPKNPAKILDEFWYLAHEGHGFGRLDRELHEVFQQLDISPEKSLRMSLLTKCNYDAAVIADDEHADSNAFSGFEHVTDEAERCVATYIGSRCWTDLAESTRNRAICSLISSGIW